MEGKDDLVEDGFDHGLKKGMLGGVEERVAKGKGRED